MVRPCWKFTETGSLSEENFDKQQQVILLRFFSSIPHNRSIVFVEASKASKAMIAYEKDLAWQELFDLALRTSVQADQVVAMGYRVAGSS